MGWVNQCFRFRYDSLSKDTSCHQKPFFMYTVAHISDKKHNDVIANCCGDPCPSIHHIQLHGNWCSRGCSGSLECSNIRHLTSDDGKSGKLYLNSSYLRTGKKHVKFDVNEGNFAAVMRVTTVSIL